MSIKQSIIRYRVRYWLGKLCKELLGRCLRCGNSLNFTRHNVGICPNCGRRC